jgi:Sulfatase-modifying factor enzyme 1
VATSALLEAPLSPRATALPVTVTPLPPSDGMVRIEDGLYKVGSSKPDEFHMASKEIRLAAFWIDKYEVTNAHYMLIIRNSWMQLVTPSPRTGQREPSRPAGRITQLREPHGIRLPPTAIGQTSASQPRLNGRSLRGGQAWSLHYIPGGLILRPAGTSTNFH